MMMVVMSVCHSSAANSAVRGGNLVMARPARGCSALPCPHQFGHCLAARLLGMVLPSSLTFPFHPSARKQQASIATIPHPPPSLLTYRIWLSAAASQSSLVPGRPWAQEAAPWLPDQ